MTGKLYGARGADPHVAIGDAKGLANSALGYVVDMVTLAPDIHEDDVARESFERASRKAMEALRCVEDELTPSDHQVFDYLRAEG